jgi:peptidoglycan/LPS O-acetylase OafA/YrhL
VTSPTPVRLAWLDALRGYAALVVVVFHLSPTVLGTDRHLAIYRHFDLGKYGVLLFFLVSGYVIPMSLERHGSLRRFWIGRLCRIYPAYLAAIALVLLLSAAGWLAWTSSLRHQTAAIALAHVTMMSDLVGVRGAVRVLAATASRLHLFSAYHLRHPDRERWRQLRQTLELPHEARRQQGRFRRPPDRYLASLEAIWLKASLPS